MIIDLGLRMESSETEMSLTQERRTSEEGQGFDRSVQEGNNSKQSKGFHNKRDGQSDTLSSNLEQKKTSSNNLDKTTSSNNLEQTTLFTSPHPLTSVLQSCQQACTTCHAMNVASYGQNCDIISVQAGDQCLLYPGGNLSSANTLVLIAASNLLNQCCKGTDADSSVFVWMLVVLYIINAKKKMLAFIMTNNLF